MPRCSRFLMMCLLITPPSLFGCIGCTQMTQSEMKYLESRDIDAPYPDVYDAALNAMFSMGLVIIHTDKESGIITGQSGDEAQRASVGWIWRPLYPVKKVTLMVRPEDPGVTRIRMKVLVNEKQQLDHKLMTAIWQRIEREGMLETRPSKRTPTTRKSPKSAATHHESGALSFFALSPLAGHTSTSWCV